MNNTYKQQVHSWLNDQPQENPQVDTFDAIMDHIHTHKRKLSIRIPAITAILLAGILLWLIPQINNSQLKNLQQLTEKISLIEQVVRNEVIHHSEPGSPILEKMVSMENWLDQLDKNIAQTNDTNQKIELLHAKLEILDDLVALHRKYKPQYQQVI